MKTQLCLLTGEKTLGQWLLEGGYSKQRIKKFISDKNVRDKVLLARKEIELPLDLINSEDVCSEYEGPDVQVIFEDENFLGVSKPPLIHSVAQKYSDRDSLSSWLRKNLPQIYQTHYPNRDCGLLFRLDYETSGVCLFAKRAEDYRTVRDHFDQLVKEKVYIAIATGIPVWKTLEIKLGMKAMGKGSAKIVAKPEPFEMSYAPTSTKLEVLKTYKENNLCLLKVKIQSGHRHQIRAACAYVGHALYADALYGVEITHKHFCLHAWEYTLNFKEKIITVRNDPTFSIPD